MTIHELLVSARAIRPGAALELASAQPEPPHSPHTDADRHVLSLYRKLWMIGPDAELPVIGSSHLYFVVNGGQCTGRLPAGCTSRSRNDENHPMIDMPDLG